MIGGAMSDVATDVMAIIKKKIRVDKPEITMDDKLRDLGLESLDALELVFDIEEKFDIEIPVNANDAQIGGFEKVSDVVREVQKVIDKKAQSK
jgi:acyl carrier protein